MSMLSERVSAAMKSSAARVCAWCERVGHEDDRVLFLTIQQGHNGAPVYATQMHGTRLNWPTARSDAF
jgi:hypothetical protein